MGRRPIRVDTVIRIHSNGLTQEIGEFSCKVHPLGLNASTTYGSHSLCSRDMVLLHLRGLLTICQTHRHEKQYCGPGYMESKLRSIPEVGKTPPMRKGGTQIWFDTQTQRQTPTEPLEQSPQELCSPLSAEAADDTGDADQNLPLPPTTTDGFQSVTVVDENCEEYPQQNFTLPETVTMETLYESNKDGTYASGGYGPGTLMTGLGLGIGIEPGFDGIDMSGFSVAYEAQMNLQDPAPLVDHHYPNLVVNNTAATDFDEGGMEMGTETMLSFPPAPAPAPAAVDWDFVLTDDLLSTMNWSWMSPPYDMADMARLFS
jgi:hypothetical protein